MVNKDLQKMEVRIEDGSNSSGFATSQTQPENFSDSGWASFSEIREKDSVKRVG